MLALRLTPIVILTACGSGTVGDRFANEVKGPTDVGGDSAPGVDAATGDGATTTPPPGGDSASVPPPASFSCAQPDPNWLMCEDFEAASGNFDAWFATSEFISGSGSDDRGRVTLDDSVPHHGQWALYMPAAASSGHQGGTLDWWDCDGDQRTNCPLVNHETLYFRTWIRFAPDHRYVHHFLRIAGSQADDFWYHGTAGCLPDGQLHMGTHVDFREGSHETHFYSYFPDMNCDTRCERYADVAANCSACASKGLPTCDQQPQCCWGNHFEPSPAVAMPVDRWFCFEMMMSANTPGQNDGTMAYWIDDVETHRESSMMWRTTPTLGFNRVGLQHYITSSDAGGHSNRVWFDDVVVSTERVGCN